MQKKKLHIVSLGPGTAEFLTLKAVSALRNSDIIFVPTSCTDGSFEHSRTYDILEELSMISKDNLCPPFKMKDYDLRSLYCPRKYLEEDWMNQVQAIKQGLEEKDVVSYVTLGDAGIYSTAYYLIDIIKHLYPDIYDIIEVIPGITSFSQASAKIKQPLCLGPSRLEILPVNGENLKATKVYMRPKVKESLPDVEEQGELFSFENLNFENEKIYKGKPDKVKGYMTLVVDFVQLEQSEVIRYGSDYSVVSKSGVE